MKKTTERTIDQISTKTIGITVPLPLHKEFRAAAEKEQMSSAALLKKLIIQYLDQIKL